ncbi:MAG: M48 family metallopeptidase [Phascolarctobacterium sp.]|nr:M48 family metallopeptidase [Phascolarctobacterium sp.]
MERGYVQCEIHYLWGKPYTPSVTDVGEKYGLDRDGEKMVLTVPPGTRREVRAALFRGFYFNEMKEALKRLIPECEKRTGLHAEEVRISNMKSCWGSCSMKKKEFP